MSHYRVRLETEVARIGQGRSGAIPRNVLVDASVAVFEELLGVVALALEDENSRLRQELREVQGARRLLADQLAAAQSAVSVTSRSKNGRFRRAAGRAMAAILVNLPAAAVGGASGAYVETVMSPSAVSAADLAVAYAGLEDAIDALHAELDNLDAQPSAPETPLPDRVEDDDGEEGHVADDPWAELQDADGNYQLHWTEDEHAGALWRDAGFMPDEAEQWAVHAFQPSEASQWRRQYFDPATSDEWRARGFDALEASEWYAELHEDPDTAAGWAERGYSPELAWDWQREDFDPETADVWYEQDFGPDEASEWAEADVDPQTANEWRALGFGPAEAAEYIENEVSPTEADARRDTETS